MKRFLWIVLFLLVILSGPLYLLVTHKVHLSSHWRSADRSSAGIAPKPADHPDALIQVYAAHAYNWRGLFSVHSWIALKPKNAKQYHVFQVSLWSLWRYGNTISESMGPADRSWFGNKPKIVLSISGDQAEHLMPKVISAIKSYPYPHRYHAWPGPNSNTFVAHVGRQVPDLNLIMPPNAVGKDYLPPRQVLAPVPSHSGYVFSLLGIYAVAVSTKEGFQLTILGLNFGVRWKPFAIIWPGVGTVW